MLLVAALGESRFGLCGTGDLTQGALCSAAKQEETPLVRGVNNTWACAMLVKCFSLFNPFYPFSQCR